MDCFNAYFTIAIHFTVKIKNKYQVENGVDVFFKNVQIIQDAKNQKDEGIGYDDNNKKHNSGDNYGRHQFPNINNINNIKNENL